MVRWMTTFGLLFSVAVATGTNVVRIGGVFDSSDLGQQASLQQAFEEINSRSDFLQQMQIDAVYRKADPKGSFYVSAQVCSLLNEGIAAVFGPQSTSTSEHVCSICYAKEIPHLEARLDLGQTGDWDWSINLYPHKDTLAQAYGDVLKSMGWERFSIIYENNAGLARVERLLQMDEFSISLKQLGSSSDYRPMLKGIQKSGVTRIVLDVERENIETLLEQAHEVGLLTPYFTYFVTSLDLQTVHLEGIELGEAKITALRLFNPQDEEVQNLVKNLSEIISFEPSMLTTEAVLMYDAAYLFARALKDIDRSIAIKVQALQCDNDGTWQQGTALFNYLIATEIRGLTGPIKFDRELRRDVSLEIIETKKSAIAKVGTWNLSQGVKYLKGYGVIQISGDNDLIEKTLVISSVLSTPYVMLREGSEVTTGNDRFEGFCIDLLEELADRLGFNYTIRIEPNGQYGSFDSVSGGWNGMISELIEHKADMALADLTITGEREKVVDFTHPWMDTGISILYKKPEILPPDAFAFLAPFSLDLWLCILASYLALFFLIIILAKFYPEESKQIQGKDSFYFKFVIHQTTKTYAVRFLEAILWMFTLFVVALYTASMVNFLTVDRIELPIESVDDLVKQTTIKYGIVKGGSTYAFFKNSNIATYQRMFDFMENDPSVYTRSIADGVERVLRSDRQFAFLMESPSIQYITGRECDLRQVGRILNSNSYGVALPYGSPYKDDISITLLEMTEEGVISYLYTKWWMRKKGGGRCFDMIPDFSDDDLTSRELSLTNVEGLFILLLVGMSSAFVFAIFEYFTRRRITLSIIRGEMVQRKPE